ncbi:MAG: hypothetical protein IT160_08765 [Bryobacterales bacterium]|nr:hypothetical protein [Bryobacterales bacterium]
MSAVKIERTPAMGWLNCYRITNGEVELIVTSDVGPRVMRYAFVGGRNLFKEFTSQLGKSGEKEWEPRGGHRLWVGPEIKPITYALDNSKVAIEIHGGVLTATGPVEPETGLQKQIIIKLAPTGSQVELIHRIKNTTLFPLEFAPWALTMMAQGGRGVTGFPPRGHHPIDLSPSNPLVMWPYTNFSDSRWKFTRKYLSLVQDPNNADAQKVAHFNQHTWGAYLLGSDLYIKRYEADPAKTYPDFGASFEMFTNNDFLELETVGPMTRVEPGAYAEQVERWSLHRDIHLNEWSDAELDRVILPLLQ